MSEEKRVDDRRARVLTDADVEAIAKSLEKKMAARFYLNVGKGVWAIAWQTILIFLIFLAGYGAMSGTSHGLHETITKGLGR